MYIFSFIKFNSCNPKNVIVSAGTLLSFLNSFCTITLALALADPYILPQAFLTYYLARFSFKMKNRQTNPTPPPPPRPKATKEFFKSMSIVQNIQKYLILSASGGLALEYSQYKRPTQLSPSSSIESRE